MSQFDPSIFCLFDLIPPRAINKWQQFHTDIADYASDHYSHMAYQRSKLYEELKSALLMQANPFEFNSWRRIVAHQFSNTPLSSKGSIKHFPGGRFNIGDIDPIRFPVFPGLYLAEDTPTAFREFLSLDPNQDHNGLTSFELNAAGNFSHFFIDGYLTIVLDLTRLESLRDFFKLIKHITPPPDYIRRAKKAKIPPLRQVLSLEELRKTLFLENWRLMPMQFDVPANSQVLGQIAYAAGLEGIIFPSVKTDKKNLVIFPGNFKDSNAYIKINGDIAESILDKIINKDTFENFI